MQDQPNKMISDKSICISDSRDTRSPLDDRWQARRELAEQLRRLTSVMLTAEVPAEQLRELSARLSDEIAIFELAERRWGREAHREQHFKQHGVRPDLLYELSPVMGMSNPVAFPMHAWREGDCIHAELHPDWSFEGPLGHLHGGVIASLFDQVLGLAQHLSGRGGVTGSLNIRFHHPTPLNQTLRMTARIARTEGRKKFIVGELWADDVRTASCEGIFFTEKAAMDEATLPTPNVSL
jgi:acyl-coenzyme A thioesterase PaaI-like protein